MRLCGFMPPGRFYVYMGRLRVMLTRSSSLVPLPAAFVSVTHQPTTEMEVSIWLSSICGTITHSIHQIVSWKCRGEIADIFKGFDRKETVYRLWTYRHKAYCSLDRNDGLEHEVIFVTLSPHELYKQKVIMQELHAAISSLPDKKAKRICTHFILGMSKRAIARAEGVDEKVVRVAIERCLRNLEKFLKNFL